MKSLAAIDRTLRAMKESARILRAAPSSQKNGMLKYLHQALQAGEKNILIANAKDLKALSLQATPAFRDRLELNSKRLAEMRESLLQVIALPDPVGETVESRTLPNGLKTSRVRAPLGILFMIFESRPNVAIEAFSLGFKAGNAMILRGGKESSRTVSVFYQLIEESLLKAGLPQNCFAAVSLPDRKLVDYLLRQNRSIDVVIPRGSEKLIEHVVKTSNIPVIKNDRGMCHIYVHEDADLEMAQEIVINGKTQRPGVCNAVETLLVHAKVAPTLLPSLNAKLKSLRVDLYADRASAKILHSADNVHLASPKSWNTEYLDLKLNVAVVSSLDQAIFHIESHGSKHSESIITRSQVAAERFQNEIDAAAVYWNASTRFTDGFQLGLGGELGISTQKLHVRGPVGLKELTSIRWIMQGNGQTRR